MTPGAKRAAIMAVSTDLLLPLIPEGKTIDCVADALGVKYDWLSEALRLPAGSRITGVSMIARFARDEVLIRVQHPDFVETEEGCVLPDVQAVYGWDDRGAATFACWAGPAVNTPRVVPHAAGPRWPQAGKVKFREFL